MFYLLFRPQSRTSVAQAGEAHSIAAETDGRDARSIAGGAGERKERREIGIVLKLLWPELPVAETHEGLTAA